MRFDQTYIDCLLLDVVAQRFDEADDLVRFVQNQTGKVDESIVTTYWLGKRMMIKDKVVLAAYIKFECNRQKLKHEIYICCVIA